MFTHIDVSRSPHCAVNNLTRATPSRASPDACGPPPHALWLSAGVPYLTVVRCGPNADGFCSRSSVYRIVRAYRAGSLGIRVDQDGQLSIAVRLTVLMPWLMRSLGAILKAAPRTYGWCRTRWSCASLAATLQAKHGIAVSAETVRRWLHEMGWVWKRAKLGAKDDDPHRIDR